MKKHALLIPAIVMCFSASPVIAQTYTLSSATNGNAQYATTCSGTFVDNGGAGGNYSNGVDASYTFYPSSPGQYITITFNSFSTQATADYLAIYDGPGGPLIGQYSGNPGVFTVTASASNSTRGLTCRFHANNFNVNAGWSATISCTGTAGAAPAFTPGAQDCQQGGGTTICDNANLTANSGGGGAVNDLANPWDGCLSGGENQSSWYYFSPSSGGNVGFTIAPANGSDDYDFALWGPFTDVECPLNISQQPLRCSYSGVGGNTGCGNGAVDVSEGAGGDAWVSTFNVVAGEIYVLVIDNYVSSGNPFTLTWNLTGGADLNCTVLPVELISFTGRDEPDHNLLEWQTASEINNDYFILDRSVNGGPWDSIATVDGTGNSSQVMDYSYRDYEIGEGITYYRLRQRDYNGTTTNEGVIYIVRTPQGNGVTAVYPVPSHGNVALEYSATYDATLTVEVHATGGRIVSTQQVAITPGNNLIKIDLMNESQGVYAVHVRDNMTGEITTRRVIIARE